MVDENELILRRAIFGKQVEDFLSSDIGRYLMHRAESDAVEAMEKLKRCPPREGAQVQALQNEIWKAESFRDWLGDAVTDGLTALGVLEDME